MLWLPSLIDGTRVCLNVWSKDHVWPRVGERWCNGWLKLHMAHDASNVDSTKQQHCTHTMAEAVPEREMQTTNRMTAATELPDDADVQRSVVKPTTHCAAAAELMHEWAVLQPRRDAQHNNKKLQQTIVQRGGGQLRPCQTNAQTRSTLRKQAYWLC